MYANTCLPICKHRHAQTFKLKPVHYFSVVTEKVHKYFTLYYIFQIKFVTKFQSKLKDKKQAIVMFKHVINKSVIIFTVNIISSLFSTARAYAHGIFYKGYCSQSGLLASAQKISLSLFFFFTCRNQQLKKIRCIPGKFHNSTMIQ